MSLKLDSAPGPTAFSKWKSFFWTYFSILVFSISQGEDEWKMVDHRGCPHSSSFSSILRETRGGWRELRRIINPSMRRQKKGKRDEVQRKRRCRRFGLAKGSPSRNIHIHTHIHRGRITLIYLVRQRLASVFSVLTPVLQKATPASHRHSLVQFACEGAQMSVHVF